MTTTATASVSAASPFAADPEPMIRLVEGCLYEYLSEWPKGCKGHRYRLHKFVIDAPSYQEKILVECLSGRDAGLWFVVSPSNFALRYKPVKE